MDRTIAGSREDSPRVKIGRSGIASEVPDLADFVARTTDSERPANAFYVQISFDDGNPAACLIFYGPTKQQDGSIQIYFGAAMHDRGWGNNAINDFVWVRHLILWIAFVGLKCDHLAAIVRPETQKVRRLLEIAKFNLKSRFTWKGRECLLYRLEG